MLSFLLPRPIAVFTTTLALALLGAVALGLLPLSLMPEVDLPEITVQVEGSARGAQELEKTVVAPLRRQLLQFSRLDDLQSETRDGSALIRLRMAFGTDIDYAFLEVNEQTDSWVNCPGTFLDPMSSRLVPAISRSFSSAWVSAIPSMLQPKLTVFYNSVNWAKLSSASESNNFRR